MPVWRHFCRPRIIIDSLLSTANERRRVSVGVCIEACTRGRACVRAVRRSLHEQEVRDYYTVRHG